MPQGETFWNPYRWVPANKQPIAHEAPVYHHRFQGVAGRIHCTLTALTPLLINDGAGRFIQSKLTGKVFIPGTSLKGMIRALVELIGNAAEPFLNGHLDREHQLQQAARGQGTSWQLDVAARMFGYLHSGKVFRGLVRFSDGVPSGTLPRPIRCEVAGGAPDPDHRPFYPGNHLRKFYHHNVAAENLTGPHAGIKADQRRNVYPLPPGAQFTFTIDFANLRDDEVNLLLYCLALEEDVAVMLSPQAAGSADPITLRGPLRHKLGSCKPQGGGSVHLRMDKFELRADPADRYRGVRQTAVVLEGEPLHEEIARRTTMFVSRTDATMTHLRAMMIYAKDDPRTGKLDYPDWAWFQSDKVSGQQKKLKPTL